MFGGQPRKLNMRRYSLVVAVFVADVSTQTRTDTQKRMVGKNFKINSQNVQTTGGVFVSTHLLALADTGVAIVQSIVRCLVDIETRRSPQQQSMQ